MTLVPRVSAIVGIVASLLLSTASPADARTGACGSAVLTGCAVEQDGLHLGAEALVNLASGVDPQSSKPDKRSFAYTSATACASSTPAGANADLPCLGAIQACAGNTPEQGQGPQVRVYRRELDAKSKPLSPQWQLIGTTCFPELVPGEPVLGMGRILAAFHKTPWAKPAVHTQPEGNTTLVTLATYFEVTWPAAGFQPGEINTTTLLNTPVRIRPTLVGYTYVFGDGTTFGPTNSPGGTYPDGDLTHAYAKAGTYTSHINITYGGEFSIRGGSWIPIPDTVTITGQPHPLTVKTAHSRLVIR